MKSLKVIAALAVMVVSSAALAEGGADRVYGRMIQANEQAMQENACSRSSHWPWQPRLPSPTPPK
ncbi:co-regulatory protein PtrA N-terminal domain-containing protein [Pseudomonas aeruginosa]